MEQTFTVGSQDRAIHAEPKQPTLVEMEKRLGSSVARIRELAGRFSFHADNIFGGRPEIAEDGPKVGGQAINYRVNDLENAIDHLESVCRRFD